VVISAVAEFPALVLIRRDVSKIYRLSRYVLRHHSEHSTTAKLFNFVNERLVVTPAVADCPALVLIRRDVSKPPVIEKTGEVQDQVLGG
jgi:hypothetical protein